MSKLTLVSLAAAREGEAPAEPPRRRYSIFRQGLQHPVRDQLLSHREEEALSEPPARVKIHTRQHPVHGILTPGSEIPIVFLTVCTKLREPWLANDDVHTTLMAVWSAATKWLVGRYVIMPDHLHLFAAPNPGDISLGAWVRYWKSQFSKSHKNPDCRWQTDYWDTRLRTTESYAGKWEYVRNNPVRHGLVSIASEWPFQGELNKLY